MQPIDAASGAGIGSRARNGRRPLRAPDAAVVL